MNSLAETWSQFACGNKLLEAWFQLSDGNKLLALLVLAGLMVYKTTKTEGLMLVPALGGAFAVMAYAMTIALRML